MAWAGPAPWSAGSGPNRRATKLPAAATIDGARLTLTTHATNGIHYSGLILTDGHFRDR